MKISFHSHANENNFHRKRWAPSLALKKRPKVIQKWPITCTPGRKCSFQPSYIHCIKDLTKCLHVFPLNTTPALMNRADTQCALLDIKCLLLEVSSLFINRNEATKTRDLRWTKRLLLVLCSQGINFKTTGLFWWWGRHLQGIYASNATFTTFRKKILLHIFYALSKMKIMSCCTVWQNSIGYESHLIGICMVNKMASFCCKIVITCWKQPLLHFVLKDENFYHNVAMYFSHLWKIYKNLLKIIAIIF